MRCNRNSSWVLGCAALALAVPAAAVPATAQESYQWFGGSAATALKVSTANTNTESS
jgi:hypothetical protein